ncbi:MAG: site-specific DNA-methyltransferase [Solirubrobacteraceae bacterium]|nr:site-specific DNA-methyltransferase [Solirubrobacteraceae bacterium]
MSFDVVSPPKMDWQVEVRHEDAFFALPTLPPGSVNLVCTSPPYWGQRTYEQPINGELLQEWQQSPAFVDGAAPGYEWYRAHGGSLGLEPYPEWYVTHLAEVLDRASEPLAADGSLWVNLGDTYFARWSSIRPAGRQGLGGEERERRRTPSGGWRHDKQLLMLPARFAIAMQDRGWILRNDLIWAKSNVGPRPETDRLRLSHEHFFHFVKRQKTTRPRYWYDLGSAETGGLDVVTRSTSNSTIGHPATFPDALIRPRILSSCPPNGLVLDPFCGAGTTLEVAASEGRRALGFEIAEKYVDIARVRLGLARSHV